MEDAVSVAGDVGVGNKRVQKASAQSLHTQKHSQIDARGSPETPLQQYKSILGTSCRDFGSASTTEAAKKPRFSSGTPKNKTKSTPERDYGGNQKHQKAIPEGFLKHLQTNLYF